MSAVTCTQALHGSTIDQLWSRCSDFPDYLAIKVVMWNLTEESDNESDFRTAKTLHTWRINDLGLINAKNSDLRAEACPALTNLF